MKQEDIMVLRELAKQYMEYATLPIQRTKMNMWKDLNAHRNTRPMVLIDQLPWNELFQNYPEELTCVIEDPILRSVEDFLRRSMLRWKLFPVDMVLEPILTIPYVLKESGFGLDNVEQTAAMDETSDIYSHMYENQLQDEEDLEKIKDHVITVDREESARRLQMVQFALEGIIPVRQAGGNTVHMGIWDFLSQYMGVNDIYIDLLERPEFIHNIMERMTNSSMAKIRQLNELGVVNTSANRCHCSLTYTDELLPDFGAGKEAHTRNAWCFGMAQLFTAVSPVVTEEFEIPYISRLAKEFGMVYYGCCDRLDDRLELVHRIPHLKKVSCSPWSEREAFAEKLRKDLVMSNKPTPAYLAGDSINMDVIAEDLKRTCNAAKNNNLSLEFILKDISTVRYDIKRLSEWADCAMKIVESY